jgi:hypothetical protein
LTRSRMKPLQIAAAIIEKRFADADVRSFFSDFPDDERHYWIASLYALLMPKGGVGDLPHTLYRRISPTTPLMPLSKQVLNPVVIGFWTRHPAERRF